MSIPQEIVRGIGLFERGEFFEAHEAWEDHWGKGGPAERALTLGLIKAAVALHHLAHDNAAGFAWQAEKAIPLLRENGTVWPELRSGDLADAIESLAAQQRMGTLPQAWERPRLTLERGHNNG